jgi:hypothetical protein
MEMQNHCGDWVRYARRLLEAYCPPGDAASHASAQIATERSKLSFFASWPALDRGNPLAPVA